MIYLFRDLTGEVCRSRLSSDSSQVHHAEKVTNIVVKNLYQCEARSTKAIQHSRSTSLGGRSN